MFDVDVNNFLFSTSSNIFDISNLFLEKADDNVHFNLNL
jgi:hypothetical protein